MRRISTTRAEPLYSVAETRALEGASAATLPPFTLMARAGKATAALALALTPHARHIWIACGPGNNGGDGLVAARHLFLLARQRGGSPTITVTLCGDRSNLPADARRALAEALSVGIRLADHPPDSFDCAIDALLGIGGVRAPVGQLALHLEHMHRSAGMVLCVDVPSGLVADTGVYLGPAPKLGTGPRYTLSLLTLKPGLFTGDGRDHAGEVWFDDLQTTADPEPPPPTAWLWIEAAAARSRRPQSSHKGTQGDVVVIGGQSLEPTGIGMTGAAILAGRAALHAGAGRVYLGLLEHGGANAPLTWDPLTPELMFRRLEVLLADERLLSNASVVCGCGGGATVASVLPKLLLSTPTLVLDADALNALSQETHLQQGIRERASRGWITVLTPHPLEAARLLGCGTADVMTDRLAAANAISQKFNAVCVLKGSGSIVTAPGQTLSINASGGPRLATAGTGDVLAGMVGAALAGNGPQDASVFTKVAHAVWHHGKLADDWCVPRNGTLTASRLAAGAGQPL